MDDLISKLQEKAGLSAEQAKQAISTMVDHVKSKVPDSLHGSIDSLFSGMKDKASGFANEAKEKLGEMGGKAEEWAGEAKGKAEEMVKGLGDKLSGLFGSKKE